MTENTEKTTGYAWYALMVLMFVYVMNFLDRQIIYMLFPLIKQDLTFSDTQLALLGTTAFAIFYTALGIPFGRIADKSSRKMLIGIGLIIWSVFSGLSGFANDFWTLFACRVMVGVGEATLGPSAISMLADYFPPKKRATVTGTYSMGIAIGAGLAAILGGYLSSFGWRQAFFIVGFPGILLAIFVFLLKEPQRTVVQTVTEEKIEKGAWKKLVFNKTFILLCLGYAFLGLATNNFSIWGATYINRLYQIQIPVIGYWFGIMTLFAGIPATLFGGVIADWFRQKSRGGRMFFGAILSFISSVLWIIILFIDNFSVIIPVSFVLLFAALAWLGAAAADATEIAGANLRGLAIAIYFFSVNIFAYIIGSNLIGKLNDVFGVTENPAVMRYVLLVCPISCLLGAICLWYGSKLLNRQESV